MEHYTSKSEKKRVAKGVEQLSNELILLSDPAISKLPCDDFIKVEIKAAKGLKAGSKKRQIKYITKCLRKIDPAPLMDFLEAHKGSKLKENQSFHEIERLRDDIITEAIEAMRQATHFNQKLDSSWKCEILTLAKERLPDLDIKAVTLAALKFARNRKPVFSREIFKILKSATEQQQYSEPEALDE
nr:DUF615 domain-containing protein [Desulfobulbaceae bacterium]